MLLLTEQQIADAIRPLLVNIILGPAITVEIISKLKEVSKTNSIKVATYRQGEDDRMCSTRKCNDCEAALLGCNIPTKFFEGANNDV
jgi:hypothetical protein